MHAFLCKRDEAGSWEEWNFPCGIARLAFEATVTSSSAVSCWPAAGSTGLYSRPLDPVVRTSNHGSLGDASAMYLV